MRRFRVGTTVAAAAMLVGGLSACALLAREPQSPWDAWLLPPATLGETVRVVQQWQLEEGAQSGILQGVLEAGPRGLTLVGLAGFGQRVLLLRYDGVEWHEERHPRLPEAWEGRRLLRALQLVYWPRDVVRSALPPGWQIEGTSADWVLTQGGRPAARIRCEGDRRWQGRCAYEDLRSGYHLRIDSQIEAP